MPFMLLVLIAVAPLVFMLLLRWEQRGEPEKALFLLLGLVLTEALIYTTQNEVPGGIFHPAVGGRPLRIPELFIPLALLARFVVRGGPRRIGPTAIAWTAFLSWYASTFVTGLLRGNAFDEATYQGKALIYLGGGFLLAVGVPTARLVRRRLLRGAGIGLGALVVAFTPTTLGRAPLVLDNPLTPGARLGLIATDAATIIVIFAVVSLLVESTREKRSSLVVIACVPALLSPFMATQRAAVVGMAMSVAVVGFSALGTTWRRRVLATPTEALLLVAILVVPLLAVTWLRAATRPSTTSVVVPYEELVTETFFAERKAQSAETRKNLWRDGLELWRDEPVTGLGMGTIYDVARAGSEDRLQGGGFHNILVDVLVRSGVVGLALFLLSLALTLRDGLLAWRHHIDRTRAAFALAATAALLGLFAKGLAESIFEKFRLATMFGLLLGVIAGVAADARAPGIQSELDESSDARVA